MSAISTGVVVRFGLLSATVRVESAKQSKPSNVRVAADENGEVRRVMQKLFAGAREVSGDEIQRARVVDDGLVIITGEDQEAADSVAAEFKKLIPVTPHDRFEVDNTTLPGDKTYYLVPSAGHEDAYHTLVRLIQNHPELAFMGRFTVRTRLAIYQLVVMDGVLALRERIPGDELRPAPLLASPSAATAQVLDTMAEQVLALPDVVQPFDLDAYRDASGAALAALLEGREVLADPKRDRSGSEPAQVATAMEALEQMLAAAAPKKRTRKPRAKA